MTIPPAAIEHVPDGVYVYIIRPDMTAAMQPISVAYQNGTLAVVASGLTGGENVVVNGQSRLQAGTRVALTNAPSAG